MSNEVPSDGGIGGMVTERMGDEAAALRFECGLDDATAAARTLNDDVPQGPDAPSTQA